MLALNRLPLPKLLLTLLIVCLLASGCSGPIQRFPTLPAKETAEPSTSDVATMPRSTDSARVERPALKFDPAEVDIELVSLVDELELPVFVTHASDGSGRLFIIEKKGKLRIFADGRLLDEPFLDITDRVESGGNEQGLLGLAFAPDYAERGYFFVNYSDEDGNTNISRFNVTENPELADPDSETIILEIDQPARNHNGGMIAFGPDGMFWIGMGDGGGSGDRYGNAQNAETLLGKMLRIDVTRDPAKPFVIPADNPWLGDEADGTAVRDEIWAAGLRNPWRFSFDRATGDLWIGDVGQNQYEEIHLAPSTVGALNYGWPILEASDCYQEEACDPAGLVLPVAEYKHEGHCSVTGGYVYRGQQFPALEGIYLYGDYCSGLIWAAWPVENGEWRHEKLLESGARISSFGEDEAGELYVIDYDGEVLQVRVK